MKICHFCTGFALSYQGGITNYVRALAESQQENDNEVWVVSEDPKEEYSYSVKKYKSNKIAPFLLTALKDKEGLKNIKAFLEKEKFDIIHLHMVLDIDWNLYEVLKPYRYIVSLHDYFYLCPRIVMMQPNNSLCTRYSEARCCECISWFNTKRVFYAIEYRIQNKLHWKSFRFPAIKQKMTSIRFSKMKQLLENADMLLPVSTRVKEIYEQSGIKGNYKVLHIGNITADQFVPFVEPENEKKKINIVMLGTLTYAKGTDLFMKLAEHLDRSKFEFHFYGRSADYAERIRKAGITDHGYYTQQQLPQILAESDLGCVLSVWEDNGPQVVMEMLNNHVPVIGTRMGGIPDFVTDGENGFLFDPYSQQEFDLIIKRLNALSWNDIVAMKKQIHPTMTTVEHAKQIGAVYADILNA